MVPKLHTCSRCSASYRYKSGLSRHITVAHHNLKYHKCCNCDYRSYDNAAVKRHKRWCKQEATPSSIAAQQLPQNEPQQQPQEQSQEQLQRLQHQRVILKIQEPLLPKMTLEIKEHDCELEFLDDDANEFILNDTSTSEKYEEYIDVGGADITVAEYVAMDSSMAEKYGISGVLVVQNALDSN